VLVVDDNRDAADSLARLIQLWGYEVRTGYNGSAVALVPEFKPDVICLDLAMPRMDGNSMARYLRQQDGNLGILVIAITGYHDEARQLLSKEAGIDHYLVKPIDPRVLEQLLKIKLLAKLQSSAPQAN
jgi:CheY-like chemotaxis protein